jgi:hypothetical protein
VNAPADGNDRVPDRDAEQDPDVVNDVESDPAKPGAETDTSSDEDQGPGWMPAILAAMALMGIIGFFVCAFSTWVLFQKRTEFAVATLRGDYLQRLEQSLLDPETKRAVMGEIETLISDLEQGEYENWQAAGIMQRLQRLPVFQWGELQAIEAFLRNASDEQMSESQRQEGLRQLNRLRQAVNLGKVTSFDFVDVLEPVQEPSATSPSGFQLVSPLDAKRVEEAVGRAKLLSDRSGVPEQDLPEVKIEAIVEREIELGASEGGY